MRRSLQAWEFQSRCASGLKPHAGQASPSARGKALGPSAGDLFTSLHRCCHCTARRCAWPRERSPPGWEWGSARATGGRPTSRTVALGFPLLLDGCRLSANGRASARSIPDCGPSAQPGIQVLLASVAAWNRGASEDRDGWLDDVDRFVRLMAGWRCGRAGLMIIALLICSHRSSPRAAPISISNIEFGHLDASPDFLERGARVAIVAARACRSQTASASSNRIVRRVPSCNLVAGRRASRNASRVYPTAGRVAPACSAHRRRTTALGGPSPSQRHPVAVASHGLWRLVRQTGPRSLGRYDLPCGRGRRANRATRKCPIDNPPARISLRLPHPHQVKETSETLSQTPHHPLRIPVADIPARCCILTPLIRARPLAPKVRAEAKPSSASAPHQSEADDRSSNPDGRGRRRWAEPAMPLRCDRDL